jgi:hypothetical protein
MWPVLMQFFQLKVNLIFGNWGWVTTIKMLLLIYITSSRVTLSRNFTRVLFSCLLFPANSTIILCFYLHTTISMARTLAEVSSGPFCCPTFRRIRNGDRGMTVSAALSRFTTSTSKFTADDEFFTIFCAVPCTVISSEKSRLYGFSEAAITVYRDKHKGEACARAARFFLLQHTKIYQMTTKYTKMAGKCTKGP